MDSLVSIMVSLHYIIATYAGKVSRLSRANSLAGKELTLQLETLESVLKQKQANHLPCALAQITVVCPPVKSSSQAYPDYYREEYWSRVFPSLGVKITFLPYQGNNAHYSYDQWIQGYLSSPHLDYHLLMEDDYCVSPDALTFDLDLIALYQSRFPSNIGYLCALFSTTSPNDGAHAAISNGLISRSTWLFLHQYLSPDYKQSLLDIFYAMPSRVPHIQPLPQLMFSYMFSLYVPCRDILPEYKSPFWNHQNTIIEYNTTNSNAKYILIPIQMLPNVK